MSDKYICMKCKNAGVKKSIPYKIIQDDNGEGIRFIGNLCEHCFEELMKSQEEKISEVQNEHSETAGGNV